MSRFHLSDAFFMTDWIGRSREQGLSLILEGWRAMDDDNERSR